MVKKSGSVVKTGLGLAAIAAAAAGAYYFYGKDGTKNRKALKGWAVKAKGEVMEKMESMTDVGEKDYHQVVDSVLNRYKTLKHIAPKELASLSKEMKSHWKSIKQDLAKVSKVK